MKKFLVLVLCLAMLLSTAACGEGTQNPTAPSSSTSGDLTPTTSTSPSTNPTTGTPTTPTVPTTPATPNESPYPDATIGSLDLEAPVHGEIQSIEYTQTEGDVTRDCEIAISPLAWDAFDVNAIEQKFKTSMFLRDMQVYLEEYEQGTFSMLNDTDNIAKAEYCKAYSIIAKPENWDHQFTVNYNLDPQSNFYVMFKSNPNLMTGYSKVEVALPAGDWSTEEHAAAYDLLCTVFGPEYATYMLYAKNTVQSKYASYLEVTVADTHPFKMVLYREAKDQMVYFSLQCGSMFQGSLETYWVRDGEVTIKDAPGSFGTLYNELPYLDMLISQDITNNWDIRDMSKIDVLASDFFTKYAHRDPDTQKLQYNYTTDMKYTIKTTKFPTGEEHTFVRCDTDSDKRINFKVMYNVLSDDDKIVYFIPRVYVYASKCHIDDILAVQHDILNREGYYTDIVEVGKHDGDVSITVQDYHTVLSYDELTSTMGSLEMHPKGHEVWLPDW